MVRRNQSLSLLIFIITVISFACHPATSEKDKIEEDANTNFHEVYLDFDEDSFEVHQVTIKSQLLKLGELPSVQKLSQRKKEETCDPRHFELYDMLLYVEFSSEENMAQYASDSTHLEVRKVIGPWLINPPVIFDTSSL